MVAARPNRCPRVAMQQAPAAHRQIGARREHLPRAVPQPIHLRAARRRRANRAIVRSSRRATRKPSRPSAHCRRRATRHRAMRHRQTGPPRRRGRHQPGQQILQTGPSRPHPVAIRRATPIRRRAANRVPPARREQRQQRGPPGRRHQPRVRQHLSRVSRRCVRRHPYSNASQSSAPSPHSVPRHLCRTKLQRSGWHRRRDPRPYRVSRCNHNPPCVSPCRRCNPSVPNRSRRLARRNANLTQATMMITASIEVLRLQMGRSMPGPC